MMATVKILVTGGAGFIGSHVVRVLLEGGAEVVVLDNLVTGKEENLPRHRNLTFMKGDVTDGVVVKRALEGCEHVVHLAALVSVPLSMEQPEQTFRDNVQGFETVLQAARAQGVMGWVLYASSAAVYGPLEKASVVEVDALGAKLASPYAASKAMNEIQGRIYRDVYGIKTLGLRFFNVYGPGQGAGSPYAGVLAKVVHSVETGELLTIFGDGTQTRDYVAVQDVALAVKQLLLRAPSAATPYVLNVGSGIAVSLLDAIRQVVALKQVNPRVEYRPARGGDIKHSCAEVGALRAALGVWEPQTLQVGLRGWLVK